MNLVDMPHRLATAISAQDLDTLVDCFADGYDCVLPLHPERSFRGRAAVRANWTALFDRLPDIRAHVRDHVRAGDTTIWTEWELQGTRTDGVIESMAGVVIFRIADDGRAAAARFYLDPVTGS